MERMSKVALLAVSVFFVVGWVKPSTKPSESSFQTVAGTGPDKWASVWLVRRHLNSEPVAIKSSIAELSTGAISFDTDSSLYTRTGISTTYTAFLSAHTITDPVTLKLGRIIHDIEINAWNPNREIESLQVENGFRQMQLAYGRQSVTQECYMVFFTRVAKAIEQASITLETDSSKFIPDASCLDKQDTTTTFVSDQKKRSQVPELELSSVLDSMSASKKVVFLDTREAFEYKEGHIPGAVNLTLRQIDSEAVNSLIDADLVVAYCVKDFRGFEAARKLRKHGVNAVIMKPYGIKGWRNAGLPVEGSRGLSNSEGNAAMQHLLVQHLDDRDKTI